MLMETPHSLKLQLEEIMKQSSESIDSCGERILIMQENNTTM